jgi:DNA-binding PadR family transcriptional regulator
MLTNRQLIILFLISSEPGIKNIYTLVKLFDKVDFPARISENINELLQKKLIIISENFDNGTAKNYKITIEGESYLRNNFNDIEIIKYISEMDEPELILEIIKTYIKIKNGS